MVNSNPPIFSLSDAASHGLTAGQFDAGRHAAIDGAMARSLTGSQYIQYVGTKEWENHATGVVLLHGGSGDWRHFGANLGDLSTEHAVVAVDLPGFGGSDLPETVDLAGLVAPLAVFLRALPWRDVTLVGFSFGALVAAAVAAECTPARLFLVSPAGFGAHTPEMAAARDEAARVAKAGGVREGLEVNLRRIMLHDPDAAESEALLRVMEEMLRATRMKARSFSRSELILDRLRQVACPVRVLFGAADPFHASVMARRHADIAAACPQARIETVEGAAHWLMMERPEVFGTALRGFLAERGAA